MDTSDGLGRREFGEPDCYTFGDDALHSYSDRCQRMHGQRIGDGDGESDLGRRGGDSDGLDGVQWRIDDDHAEREHRDNPVAIPDGSQSVCGHCWADGDDVEYGSVDDDDRF